ncbi:NADPH oxidase 5-like [Oratosquilla oratoria]|uniref:NADPH oxidase 5-like n=1 Tax=Oratosquilla oratoria TaxID=337810 RepID=UPI003F75DBFF
MGLLPMSTFKGYLPGIFIRDIYQGSEGMWQETWTTEITSISTISGENGRRHSCRERSPGPFQRQFWFYPQPLPLPEGVVPHRTVQNWGGATPAHPPWRHEEDTSVKPKESARSQAEVNDVLREVCQCSQEKLREVQVNVGLSKLKVFISDGFSCQPTQCKIYQAEGIRALNVYNSNAEFNIDHQSELEENIFFVFRLRHGDSVFCVTKIKLSSAELTRDNLEWLERLFRHSLGHKSELSFEDFKKIVNSRNSFFAERVFQIFDVDNSGSVSLREFLDAMHQFAGKSPGDKIKFLFKVYDLDGDGLIQQSELQQVMKACMEENGMKFNLDQIQDLTMALFEDADPHRTGTITYDALKAQLEKHPGLLENLSISIDRWIVPPKPEASNGSIWRHLARIRPYQLTLPYLKNNYVYLSFLFVYISVNVGLFVARAVEYSDHNAFIIVARACGQALNLNCTLSVVFMLRQTITFLRAHGAASFLPLDQHLYLHKMSGWLIFILSIVHTIAHLLNLGFAVLPDRGPGGFNAKNLTATEWLITMRPEVFGLVPGLANPTGVVLLVILIVMVVCSQPFVRKSGYFEVFYFTHLLYVVFLVLTILHGPRFWIWFIGPGILFLIERVWLSITMRAGRGKTYISSGVLLPSRVIHLVVKRPPQFHFHPGDYIFVKIPNIAQYEWHPFTVSSAPEQEDDLWLHIRAVGEWTNRLFNYFEEEQAKCDRNFCDKAKVLPPSASPLHGGREINPAGDLAELEVCEPSHHVRIRVEDETGDGIGKENEIDKEEKEEENEEPDSAGFNLSKHHEIINDAINRFSSYQQFYPDGGDYQLTNETTHPHEQGISNPAFVPEMNQSNASVPMVTTPKPRQRRKPIKNPSVPNLISTHQGSKPQPLAKSMTMADLYERIPSKNKKDILRHNGRAASELSLDQKALQKAHEGISDHSLTNCSNKIGSMKYRYMRHKPKIITLDLPSDAETEDEDDFMYDVLLAAEDEDGKGEDTGDGEAKQEVFRVRSVEDEGSGLKNQDEHNTKQGNTARACVNGQDFTYFANMTRIFISATYCRLSLCLRDGIRKLESGKTVTSTPKKISRQEELRIRKKSLEEIKQRKKSRQEELKLRKKSRQEERRMREKTRAEEEGQCFIGKPLMIYLDGPYGAPSSHIFRAQHAVLIATGIGVTPFASILQSIMHKYWKARHICPQCSHSWTSDIPASVMNLRKVDFFWINRDQRSFEWFVSLLSQLELEQAEQGGVLDRFLDMHMYITSALQKTDMKALGLQLALDLLHEKEKRDLITGLKTRTNAGRPNWDKVFRHLAGMRKGKITVFYCGPPALGRILRYKCDEHGFEFRKEVF